MRLKTVLPVLLLIAASAGAENVELTLQIDTRPLPPKKETVRLEGAKPLEASTQKMQVTLGRNFFLATDENGRTTIRDFARRLRFSLEKDKAAVASSLYAEVGGREREMENRVFLAEALDEGGAENPIPVAVSEQELSMPANPPVENIQRDVKEGAVRFRWKSIPLGEYSTSTVEASADERKAFARFLRYTFGGHPRLLADLETAPGIPSSFKLVNELADREQRITVIKLERRPDAPYASPSKAGMELASHALWGPIVQRAASFSPEAVEAHAKSLGAAGDAAAAANKPLDAFLLYMEAYLTLNQMPSGLQRNGPAIMSDETVKRVRGAISPANAEQARKSLAVLEETRKTNPERAHVLRIFEANILTNLGEREKAFEQFHAVLSTEPRIAGVWHDLGMLFLGGYEAEAAWNCWDVARRLVPTHGMLKAIDTREKDLVEKYPYFF